MADRDGGRYEPEPGWVRPVWWVTMLAIMFIIGSLWATDGSGGSEPLRVATFVASGLTVLGGLALGLRSVGEFVRSVKRGKS